MMIFYIICCLYISGHAGYLLHWPRRVMLWIFGQGESVSWWQRHAVTLAAARQAGAGHVSHVSPDPDTRTEARSEHIAVGGWWPFHTLLWGYLKMRDSSTIYPFAICFRVCNPMSMVEGSWQSDRKVWRNFHNYLHNKIQHYGSSQFHIAPHELKKIAQAKKSIPFYVIKRAKKIFFRFFHFLGCLWAPKNIYPRKKFKFLRGPPGAPPCEKKCLLKAKMSFLMP